ncbi:hypothetical protein HNP46_000132 [Pseudomonas nitritireducens]|uniref:Uncharacterized protein n=1 Tax=Pseudomonas nitroreducens TaxID=46680 RepID=A0A7W7NYC9_PSENT|nr:hypothetical protein [Pseudomonas nitritireducens]MBB4861321.1 hypothetical protein [Pseudomonas nitritireducens]
MFKTLIPAAFALFSAFAFADEANESHLEASGQAVPEITVANPAATSADAGQAQLQAASPHAGAPVPPLPGAEELYEAYVRNGYMPQHALLLTNWDAVQALSAVYPHLSPPAELAQKMEQLRNSYHSVK